MHRPVLSRRGVLLLGIAAVGLVPWTLYLTFTLPSRHVSDHYDIAWVGFDAALAVSFAVTVWAATRGTYWLVPAASVSGTMLLCDAWFDIVTAQGWGERWEAIVEAAVAELPLTVVCVLIVRDAETFLKRLRPHGTDPAFDELDRPA